MYAFTRRLRLWGVYHHIHAMTIKQESGTDKSDPNPNGMRISTTYMLEALCGQNEKYFTWSASATN